MSLVKFKSAKPVSQHSNVWDDFFNRSFHDSRHAPVSGNTSPAVNVVESDNDYRVEVAAPGFDKQDFHVELDNGLLHIKGELSAERGKVNYSRKEFNYNSFKRSFRLPDSVNDGKIDAEYKNGILNVWLPKKEEAKVQPAKFVKIR